uniref:Sulfatase-modifying factor enzyme-like domain-containing protein n=1 Tax=Magnetococcus massalia (strain MO-1) TaxID=451514 RepID=A0A1S7LMI4_MAGMO|nr:conserved exported protein of unknown function [Candidatus Magnetococcus massalia]
MTMIARTFFIMLVMLVAHDGNAQVAFAQQGSAYGAKPQAASGPPASKAPPASPGKEGALDPRALLTPPERTALFSPGGDRVAETAAGGGIQIRTVNLEGDAIRLKGHSSGVTAMTFNADGQLFATSGGDLQVKLWEIPTGKLRFTLAGHSAPVREISFSSGSRFLLTSSDDGTVRLWDTESGRMLGGHHRRTRMMLFTPDRRYAMSADLDDPRVLRRWEVVTGKTVGYYQGHQMSIIRAAYAPAGLRLATADAGGGIILWDGSTQAPISILEGHSGPVTELVFSKDGNLLLSADRVQSWILWDARTGQPLQSVQASAGGILAATLHGGPPARPLFLGPRGALRVWDNLAGGGAYRLLNPPTKPLILPNRPAHGASGPHVPGGWISQTAPPPVPATGDSGLPGQGNHGAILPPPMLVAPAIPAKPGVTHPAMGTPSGLVEPATAPAIPKRVDGSDGQILPIPQQQMVPANKPVVPQSAPKRLPIATPPVKKLPVVDPTQFKSAPHGKPQSKRILPAPAKKMAASKPTARAPLARPKVAAAAAKPTQKWSKKSPQQRLNGKSAGIRFIQVPGGCFQMGGNSKQLTPFERPAHTVCLKTHWMSQYEVTQAQWEKMMGKNPSFFKLGPNYPVEQVSWDDAQRFITKLNRQAGKKGLYRLPTEAEWEYACRSGGKRERFCGSNKLDDVAWHAGNGGLSTHAVGKRRPNALGLFDMTGNVLEWTLDGFQANYYAKSPKHDPMGPRKAKHRSARGGSWRTPATDEARATLRYDLSPKLRHASLGFRLVRTQPPATAGIGAQTAANRELMASKQGAKLPSFITPQNGQIGSPSVMMP